MKAIVVFALLFASVLADSDEWNSYSSDRRPQGTAIGVTPEVLDILARQNEQQKVQSVSDNDSGLGSWANYPESASFSAKVQGRLESSRTLRNKPLVRQKLIQIADEKFSQCKNKVDNEERACLGHATGQVMQLVSAVENISRNQQ